MTSIGKADAQGQERAPFRRRRQFAKADSCCGETGPSSQQQGQGRQWRKGQRRRGKLRPGRDLRDAGPARPRDRARHFPRHQSGCPLFFQRNRVHEICQPGARHSSFPSHFKARRNPMPASPRRRARCNRHDARAGIVALVSCCLVRLSNGGLGPPGEILSLPACTQRRICRGAASASRLDSAGFQW